MPNTEPIEMTRKFAFSAVCLLLCACGGGGGGGGEIASVSTVVPGPAPTQTTTPPPPPPAPSTGSPLVSPVMTSSPAGLNATGSTSLANTGSSATFALLQTAVSIEKGFSGDGTTTNQGATLTLDPARRRYGLTLNNESLGVVDATATNALTMIDGYNVPGSAIPGGRTLTTNVQGLDYTTYGYWLIQRFPSRGVYEWTNGGAWLGGYATPASDIPATGTATFIGNVTGLYDEAFIAPGDVALLLGNVRVTADFGGRAVTGTMTNLGLGSDWVRHGAMNDIAFTAAFDPALNMFSGLTRVTTVPAGSTSAFESDASGVVSGRFFGPASNEVGGVFTLSDSVRRLIGSFGARRN